MQLPKRAFDPSEESFFETYILSCPWCDEALFHLETVPDTPFVTKRAGDPIIQSKGSDFFCVCPQCSVRVDVRSEGGALQVSNRPN